MLLAAGVVLWEQWLNRALRRRARFGWGATWAALGLGAVFSGALMLPIAPVNSGWWDMISEVHDNFVEEIGWPELVATVADIYAALPPAEQAQTGILTGNYGEAGAINLYGPAYGLPEAISGINSYWLRGYGDPPPQTLIVLGYSQRGTYILFRQCKLAGQITNRYGVENEETEDHPIIYLCREPRQSWPAFWEKIKHFG
jgi:hypothetical protein